MTPMLKQWMQGIKTSRAENKRNRDKARQKRKAPDKPKTTSKGKEDRKLKETLLFPKGIDNTTNDETLRNLRMQICLT
jgi:hypothetical protein